jgi:ABC-2 type transport system ATP-binding protein
MSAIEFRNVSKSYRGVRALSDVSLSVSEGEVYGLLGPNGAGKSTVLGVALDYVLPDSGSVSVLGTDPSENARSLRRRIGLLPDEYAVFDNLSGREHVEYVASAKDADADIDELFRRVGLDGVGPQRATGYSTGMKQRLVLAMALVGRPELLVLDEPFSGLDPHGTALVRDLIETERERGATVLVSSHVLSSVEPVSDRIGILTDGRLVTSGTPDSLRRDSDVSTTLRIEFDGAPPATRERISDIPNVTDVSVRDGIVIVDAVSGAVQSAVLTQLQEAGVRVRSVSVDEPDLEDVFASFTRDAP